MENIELEVTNICLFVTTRLQSLTCVHEPAVLVLRLLNWVLPWAEFESGIVKNVEIPSQTCTWLDAWLWLMRYSINKSELKTMWDMAAPTAFGCKRTPPATEDGFLVCVLWKVVHLHWTGVEAWAIKMNISKLWHRKPQFSAQWNFPYKRVRKTRSSGEPMAQINSRDTA